MIRALKLIFIPAQEWEKIANSNVNYWKVIFLFLLPLMALASAVDGYCLVHFGQKVGEFGLIRRVAQDLAIRYEGAYLGLTLVSILLGARFIQTVCVSFHVPANFLLCFATIAYGMSPILLAHMLDGIPIVNTWICWAIGIAVSWSILYHGVALMLKPEQTKGFGLYIFSIVFLLVLSGLTHFIALQVLEGRLAA